MLEQVAEGVWQATDVLAAPGGVRFPLRMTVLRVEDGTLVVHSPVRLDDVLVNAINALGNVSTVIGPNKYHHLHLRSAMERWPQARLLGAPGLSAKRVKLPFAGELATGTICAGLDALHLAGAPGLEEVVFRHGPSRTLVVTDLLFNVVRPDSWQLALALTPMGTRGRLAVSRLVRWGYVRDKSAFAADVKKMLAWEFDRVMMAHGEVLEGAGGAAHNQAEAALHVVL